MTSAFTFRLLSQLMLSVVPVGTTDALLMFIGIFPYINYFGIIKVTGETVTLVLKTYYHTLEAAATEVPHKPQARVAWTLRLKDCRLWQSAVYYNRKYEYLCTVPPNSDIKRF